MSQFDRTAKTPPTGSSSEFDWGSILGGVKDIFAQQNNYNLQKKQLGYAAQYAGGGAPGGYAKPQDNFASGDYQKWGFVVGLLGLGIAVLAFVLKK